MTSCEPWMETVSGRRVDLLDPKPEQIDPSDICYALSRLCRFTGHVAGYSVAQHTLLVAANVPREFRAVALLHDAAEAYIGDISKPLKSALRVLCGSGLGFIELGIWKAIRERFSSIDLPAMFPGEVLDADIRALATERRDLFGVSANDWRLGVEPFSRVIAIRTPEDCEIDLCAAFAECGIR